MDVIASFIDDLSAELRRQFGQGFSAGGSFTDSVLGFSRAVDWTEPWLILLLSFHVILFGIALKTRKKNNFQMGIFISALLCVYMAETLNTLLARNWNSFARQPYFDRHGVFMSTVWSGPLLLIACTILVNGLVSLSALIIKWKKAELRHRALLMSQKENKTD